MTTDVNPADAQPTDAQRVDTRRALSRRRFLSSGAAAAVAAPAALAGIAAAPAIPGVDRAGTVALDRTTPMQRARVSALPPGLGLDTTHRIFTDGSVEVLLWPGDLARVQAAGVAVELLDADLRPTRLTEGAGVRPIALSPQPGESTTGDYRTLAEHEADLQALAVAHPDIARLITLPFVTFEGRRVLCLELATNVHGLDGRPTFHVDGLHHAREWPAGEMAVMFATDLAESHALDSRVRALLDTVRVTVVPVVNPDGFTHSRGAFAETPGGAEALVLGGRQAYWRKNRRSFTDGTVGDGLGLTEAAQNPQGTGLDAYGVDPNRNYGFTWGRPGSSSADVHSQSCRGDEPFSEPESRNIAWLARTRHVTGAISHHTYAGEIIWPWANEMGEAPDAALFATIAGEAGASNGYRARKYNTSEGTTPDHLYGATSTLAFLFEHGEAEFHPPYAGDIPQRYADNRDAFLLLAERTAAEPTHHGTITGRLLDANGQGVAGEVVTRRSYDTPLWLFGDGAAPRGRTAIEERFSARAQTEADGSFTLRVNPSTQPHVIRAGGSQAWELALHAGDDAGATRRVVIGRGQTVNLGDITAS